MKTVSPAQVESGNENTNPAELALPPSVQVALGELVNAAKDGLLALSVGVGLGVLHELMEVEVVRGAVGSGGARDPASGLSQQPEEAEGSPDPERGRGVGSSPDNDGSCRDLRTARAWLARQRGVAEANQWSNLLKTPPGSNPMDMGGRCGWREPADLAGSWSSVATTSRRRGCVTGAA